MNFENTDVYDMFYDIESLVFFALELDWNE